MSTDDKRAEQLASAAKRLAAIEQECTARRGRLPPDAMRIAPRRSASQVVEPEAARPSSPEQPDQFLAHMKRFF
jgi:hypothetical protein